MNWKNEKREPQAWEMDYKRKSGILYLPGGDHKS